MESPTASGGGPGATRLPAVAVSIPPQSARAGSAGSSATARASTTIAAPPRALGVARRTKIPSPVIFPSIAFAIFFPIVLCLSWALMPRPARWKPFILLASYVFYAAADPRFCLLLAGATLFNQLAAVLLAPHRGARARKAI